MRNLLILLLLPCSVVFAQPNRPEAYPKGYFRNPLGIPLQLSANFGEVRKDHFHMGLDIRTQQKENLPVYAAAEGYISRVSIEQGGYGKAIYIQHPAGYVTVYGHLNSFYDTLEQFLKAKQYHDEQWEQDFSLSPHQFPVKKGQFIARSGNTGASGGPHLHFEIRDSRTGYNLNPLLFDLGVPDNIAPYLQGLYWYDRRYSTYQASPRRIPVTRLASGYRTTDSLVRLGSPLVSFGIRAEDKTNNSPFLFGVYEAGIWVDDSLRCYFQLNNFSYTDTRYLNGSIDYKTYSSTGPTIQHLSQLPGNKLSVYTADADRGVIRLNDTLIHTIRILIKDVAGNASVIQFRARYDASLQNNLFFTMNSIALPPNQPNTVGSTSVKATFGANAFYDMVPFVLGETGPAPWPAASVTAQLHQPTVPVHDNYTVQLALKDNNMAAYADRLVMQLQNNRYGMVKKADKTPEGWYKASFRNLGKVQLLADTIPPVIKTIGWQSGKAFPNQSTLRIRCSDNLGSVRYFSAQLDGKWLLFTHSTQDYLYQFDEHCPEGEHTLTISVQDIAGNRTVQELRFTRLPVKAVKPAAKKTAGKKRR
ncbi:peptidoglycan DD-metalloendopeptidase family protein [Filimonas effusa]|uniref:M23 family metallopeptidase n=1 Tax=Filimonas effusa TaxID=2508721 RepID=A0A4Q1CZG7_9BACT|nr:peptidoglycan DD-metalloendopeptidase family protein [Filimonas effusa]RXK80783.1 M23 family metallopeptidase [Filimonas effusa]